MSTHNIGFYEELTKIIFELSSNIIKYATYFFCASHRSFCCFHLIGTVNIHVFVLFTKYDLHRSLHTSTTICIVKIMPFSIYVLFM